MLRAVWKLPLLRYELLEISTATLKLIKAATCETVGKRTGRQSIGADVLGPEGERLFRLHFDASDGKCSIRNLPVRNCISLLYVGDTRFRLRSKGITRIYRTCGKPANSNAVGGYGVRPSTWDLQLGTFES